MQIVSRGFSFSWCFHLQQDSSVLSLIPQICPQLSLNKSLQEKGCSKERIWFLDIASGSSSSSGNSHAEELHMKWNSEEKQHLPFRNLSSCGSSLRANSWKLSHSVSFRKRSIPENTEFTTICKKLSQYLIMLSVKNLHFISYSTFFSWLQLATTGPCRAYICVIKEDWTFAYPLLLHTAVVHDQDTT